MSRLSTARALGLWLTIRAQMKVEGKEWVRVRTHLLEGIGLGTTWARSRAYAELAKAGLIEIRRRKGYAPLVRLVPQRAGEEDQTDGQRGGPAAYVLRRTAIFGLLA